MTTTTPLIKRRWSVFPSTDPTTGVYINDVDGDLILIPRSEVEQFVKQVFAAATGREFMGERWGKPIGSDE